MLQQYCQARLRITNIVAITWEDVMIRILYVQNWWIMNIFYVDRRMLSGFTLLPSALPDTYNCVLRMRRERRERFPRHRLQRKPPVSVLGKHHGTCATHLPWWKSGSLTHCGGEGVPGISGACATRNFQYLVRGPWYNHARYHIWYDVSKRKNKLLYLYL